MHPPDELVIQQTSRPTSSDMAIVNLPPIFRLTHDVTWVIFSLNADMELYTEKEFPALSNLRHASQVCSSWRELAINSPSLWGRVLNLQCLSRASKEWREEVLRRTGTSSLHLKVVNHYYERSWLWLDVAEWLLTAQWVRVRSLNIATACPPNERQSLWRQLFEKPAPCLEVFEFWCPALLPNLTAPDFILFANTAPLLRTLSCEYVALNLATLSVNNLRCLKLSPFTMTALELLHGVSQMPVLESLEISGPITTSAPQKHSTETLPLAELPRLGNIRFRMTDMDVVLSILAHIIPATHCIFNVYGQYKEKQSRVGSMELYSKVLSRYLGYCSELTTTADVKVFLREKQFKIQVGQSSRPHFVCYLNSVFKDLPEDTIFTMLSLLSTIRYNTFTSLDFNTCYILEVSESGLPMWIESLNSINELVASWPTLMFLNKIQARSPITIMPKLTINRICMGHFVKHALIALANFLDSLIKINISMHGITVRIPSSNRDYFKLLKRFEGLRMQTWSPRPSSRGMIFRNCILK